MIWNKITLLLPFHARDGVLLSRGYKSYKREPPHASRSNVMSHLSKATLVLLNVHRS